MDPMTLVSHLQAVTPYWQQAPSSLVIFWTAREQPKFTKTLFAWLISHQPAALFSHSKPATSHQSAVLFSQNKPAPVINQQPTEQAANHRNDKISANCGR
jgi:hypothetical protein